MGKLIDLHSHTVYSDGELSPDELILMAKENGIGTLSITDHNNVNAYNNINYEDLGDLKLVTGVELSAKVDEGQMHIVGLGIDYNNKKLKSALEQLKQVCINTVSAEIRQIDKDYGIRFSSEDVQNLLSAPHNIGRPDIAKLCIKYGYVTSVGEAFDKYLVEAHEKVKEFRKNFTYQECINLILNSGGIPILAHPKSLKLNEKELLIMIRKMIDCGLKGIEVYHSSHNENEVNLYSNIARELNLLVSGGSDYHGKVNKPDIFLGTGKNNNLNIKKLSVLNYLNKR